MKKLFVLFPADSALVETLKKLFAERIQEIKGTYICTYACTSMELQRDMEWFTVQCVTVTICHIV